jgi:DNA-binding MarR family transcriptional regulator
MAERDLDNADLATEVDAEVAARLRLVVSRLARQLRQHATGGLTPSQFSALTTIDYRGTLRLGELAAAESVAPPTITRVVGALVEAGLVERRGDPDDARSALVAVTDAGRAAMRAVRAERTALLARRFRRLSPEQREQLPDALNLLQILAEVGDE